MITSEQIHDFLTTLGISSAMAERISTLMGFVVGRFS